MDTEVRKEQRLKKQVNIAFRDFYDKLLNIQYRVSNQIHQDKYLSLDWYKKLSDTKAEIYTYLENDKE